MARLLVGFDLGEQEPERIEGVTRQLYDELRALGAVRVDRVRSTGDEGTKSGLGTVLGQLALSGTFSAATATAVVRVIVANLKRAQARSVSLGEGESAGFDVIVVSPDGRQLAASGLRSELLKTQRRYQYYRRDGRWDYEPVKSTRRLADGRIDVAGDRPGRIALPVIGIFEFDGDRLYDVGSQGLGWHTPKLPGLGDVDWGRFFSALTDTGYDGPVCVEVEDRAYEGSLEARKRSLRQSRKFLQQFMG